MPYGVVRTDNMYGTDVREGLVSIEYLGANGSTPTAIENGNILKIGAYKTGEREIRVGAAVAVDTPLSEVALIASPEVMYDPLKKSLDEFINAAGVPARGYRFHSGDLFSVTKDALAGVSTPAVGDIVELAAGTKLSVVAAASGATSGSTVVGKIMRIEQAGKYTFYVIEVA